MKHSFAIALLLLCFSLHAGENAQQRFAINSPKVVQIVSKFGFGSGYLITPEVIITNRHVVFGYSPERDMWNAPQSFHFADNSTRSDYKTMICSRRVDLCLIILSESLQNRANIKLAQRTVVPGEDVFVIGHPRALKVPIISSGIVSSQLANIPGENAEGKPDKYLGFSITAPISQGSSGSAVISSNDELLGIAVGSFTNTQNINVVISSQEIHGFIQEMIREDKSKIIGMFSGFEASLPTKKTNSTLASSDASGPTQRLLMENKNRIDACADALSEEHLPLRTKLSIDLNTDGSVIKVQLLNGQMLDLESCLRKAVLNLKFPSGPGTPSNVILPLHFR